MLEVGIITPVRSAWASPFVIAINSNSKPQFCVDFRKLNGTILPDFWPLPMVNDLLEHLQGSIVFKTFGSFSGFWNTQLEERCK